MNDPASLKFHAIDKANILQKPFASVFTAEPPGDLPTVKSKTNVNLQNLELIVESVKKQLEAINVNKSMGPDNLHPKFVKELSSCIAQTCNYAF